jgi:hypothetical protein
MFSPGMDWKKGAVFTDVFKVRDAESTELLAQEKCKVSQFLKKNFMASCLKAWL